MIEISLSLTARHANMDKIKGSRTVVIDVLRATTVIITALQNGAKWVLPVAEINDAWERKKEFPDAILGGERDAIKLPGFDNGNSPLEYTAEKVSGRGVILTTTNGTKALENTFDADEVLIGAFLNMTAVAKYLADSDKPVHLFCAGTRGEFSMDDFLCAGGIISLLDSISPVDPDDLCILAKNTWDAGNKDIHEYLSSCKHYNTLITNRFEKDLEYCLSIDTHTIIPKLDLVSRLVRKYKA